MDEVVCVGFIYVKLKRQRSLQIWTLRKFSRISQIISKAYLIVCQGATCCWPCQYPSIIKTFYCHVFSEELASTVITWQECTRNNVLQETHVWELQKVYHIEQKNRFSIRSFLNFYIINALNRQNLDKANQTSFIKHPLSLAFCTALESSLASPQHTPNFWAGHTDAFLPVILDL